MAPDSMPTNEAEGRRLEAFRLEVAKVLEILEALNTDVLSGREVGRFQNAVRELQGIESNIWRSRRINT